MGGVHRVGELGRRGAQREQAAELVRAHRRGGAGDLRRVVVWAIGLKRLRAHGEQGRQRASQAGVVALLGSCEHALEQRRGLGHVDVGVPQAGRSLGGGGAGSARAGDRESLRGERLGDRLGGEPGGGRAAVGDPDLRARADRGSGGGEREQRRQAGGGPT